MTVRRYSRTSVLGAGRQYGTPTSASIIKQAVDSGTLSVRESVIQGSERLDTIALEVYGDENDWWVIAAASGIGWGLQAPAGTRILIPIDLAKVSALVG